MPAPQHDEPVPLFPAQHQEQPGLEARLQPRPRYRAPGYRPAGKLSGSAAIITGGDSGIGRAVAVLFAREGANVAAIYLREEAEDAKEARAAIEEAGRPAQPEEIAPAFVCLASNADSSYVTGDVLTLLGLVHDGGVGGPCHRGREGRRGGEST